MKNKALIYRFLKKRIKMLETLINTHQSHSNVKFFHLIRVEIKKIRSIIQMIDLYSNKTVSQKSTKPIDKIYKAAGKVRSMQIEKELLDMKFQKYPLLDYHKRLSSKLKNAKTAFNKTLTENIEWNKIKNKLYTQINHTNFNDYKKYLKRKSKEIKEIISMKIIPEKKYHELRTMLKNLTYHLKMGYHKFSKTAIQEWIKISNLLGKWHDLVSLKKSLLKFVSKNIKSSEENRQLISVITNINAKSEKMIIKINSELKTLFPIKMNDCTFI